MILKYWKAERAVNQNHWKNEFRAFELRGGCCQPLSVEGQGVWLAQAELGLGLWEGDYQLISMIIFPIEFLKCGYIRKIN
ncbi:MAG: hypothetical protein GVY04_16025 [Cyanobacteria bacterium]|nr:hypothetical protein [Cyanobacteria bacterium GSL.Bin1]